VLWFTLEREFCTYKVDKSRYEDRVDIWKKRVEHCEKKLDKEESNGTFLSAISTLMEDAPEIILVVYHIGLGIQPDVWGELLFSVL